MSGEPALPRSQFPSSVFFCLPNTSEPVKHKLWDCIQTRKAWRWATFIMHELCGVRNGNYDSFNWKQALFGERIPNKFGKNINIWHLLRGITLWTIWIERNNKLFNHERWHESKVKHRIWDRLIIYAKAAWKRVVIKLRLAVFQRRRCSKVLTILGGLGMFFVEDTICILSGIGKGKLGRRSSTCLVVRRFKTLDSSSHF